jgi:hypothetical protein
LEAPDPSDSAAALVYADWLEERGEVVLAKAWRWVGVMREWPWEFTWLGLRNDGDYTIYYLPYMFYDHRDYLTLKSAMTALGEALA